MNVKKSANVVATIYEGKYDISFDCIGVEQCKYALCAIMPPTGYDPCVYLDGVCECYDSKKESLGKLMDKLKKSIKELEGIDI